MKCALETVSCQVRPAGPVADLSEIIRVVPLTNVDRPSHLLRVRIHNDGYADQSYARVEHFLAGKWSVLHGIAGHSIKTGSCFGPASPKHFAADRAELLRVAGVLLGFWL